MVTGAFLGQRLMVKGKGKHHIRPDFPGVERAVEAPQLHGMAAVEEAVQVEEVVAAVVVVATAVPSIFLIPDILKPLHGFWLFPINPLHQPQVHLLAVAHPLRCNLQCLIE